MMIPFHVRRVFLLSGAGLLVLAIALTAIWFMSFAGIPSLADEIWGDKTLLYIRTKERSKCIDAIHRFLSDEKKEFSHLLKREDSWMECAVVRASTGTDIVAIIRHDGETTTSNGYTFVSRALKAGDPPTLTRYAGMHRFVENEEREIYWYDASIVGSDDIASIARSSLLGGKGILLLPESGGTGRAYVPGGSLGDEGRIASGYALHDDWDATISILHPHSVLRQWITVLRESNEEVSEGIGGIVEHRMEELPKGIIERALQKPMRIDVHEAKDGTLEFVVFGSIREADSSLLLASLQGRGEGYVRTVSDDKGEIIRRDVTLQNETKTELRAENGWLHGETAYFPLTETPLFLAVRNGNWVASNERGVLSAVLEKNGGIPEGSSQKTMHLRMKMSTARSIFDSLLPSLYPRMAELLGPWWNADLDSLELSLEKVGEGLLVRWNARSTADEIPALKTVPKDTLVK